MVLSLIAEGGANQLNRVANSIGQIGADIKQNRLLKFQQDRQANLDQQNQDRQEQLLEFEKLDTKQKFESQIAKELSVITDDQVIPTLENAIAQADQAGLNSQDLAEELLRARQGDIAGVKADSLALSSRISGLPSSIQERERLISDSQSDDPIIRDSALVSLGVKERAGTVSANERIAQDPSLTGEVASSQAQIAGAKAGATEEAKLTTQLRIKPEIDAAVAEAKAAAQERGEVFTDLARMQATLPALEETVSNLKELAPIATSTLAGRFFDTAVKELGFGSTRGATARAKFIAIVDNQVLPLLKQTFGAAFTAEEGQRLRDTFADPNATEQQKFAQLDAFIEQKRRDISTAQRQVGTNQPQDLSTLSDDELLNF